MNLLSFFNENGCTLQILGTIALVFGLLSIRLYVFRFMKFLYHVFIRPSHNLLKRYGKCYAVITGSTSGIGYAFALNLAKKGFNIILVSRSEAKLKECVDSIKKATNNSVDVQYVVGDFQKNTSVEYYEKVAEQINKYDVGLLILNAGVMPISSFSQANPNDLKALIDVNCLHHVLLTRFVLPKMKLRANRSGMIHTASVAAIGPQYGNVTYCGTKVFDDYIAQGLRIEEGDKIDVMSLRPAGVITELITMDDDLKKQIGNSLITSNDCVKSALDSLGWDNYMYPCLSHKIQGYMIELINYFEMNNLTKHMFSSLSKGTTNKKTH